MLLEVLHFRLTNLIDPNFLNNKQSMLQRLCEAYRKYTKLGETFQLHIVSSSGWDSRDPFVRFLASENHVRPTFFEKGSRSIQGQIRKKLTNHLGVSEIELRTFLNVVRFDLGVNRGDTVENLNTNLKLAGLLPLDKTITNTRYAELAWKWLEQGSNSFDKKLLDQLIHQEKLINVNRKNLIVIRHQSLDPILPEAVRDDLPANLRSMPFTEIAVDLTHFFKDGKLVNPRVAITEQQKKENEIQQWYKNNPNIEFVYYGIAHIPLVFLFGYRLNFRKPINIFENNHENNRWDLLLSDDAFPDLITRSTYSIDTGTDIVIKFSISYPISDVDVKKVVPKPRSIIELTLPSPAPDSIINIKQLENYAHVFRNTLDQIHNLDAEIRCVHVFYSGPVSLAFRCGQLISPTIHPEILIYNYSSKDNPKYKWGIHLNVPPASPDFLVEL